MAADIQHFRIIGICDISVRLPITEIHLKMCYFGSDSKSSHTISRKNDLYN